MIIIRDTFSVYQIPGVGVGGSYSIGDVSRGARPLEGRRRRRTCVRGAGRGELSARCFEHCVAHSPQDTPQLASSRAVYLRMVRACLHCECFSGPHPWIGHVALPCSLRKPPNASRRRARELERRVNLSLTSYEENENESG